MDNFFVARFFGWDWQREGRWLRLANTCLRRLGIAWTVRRSVTPFSHTTTLEQRLNLWHLCVQPLTGGVPGDLVELGCFDGKTAVIFARVAETFAPERSLHLYDHFQVAFHLAGRDIAGDVREHFRQSGCREPLIHAGDFLETVPAELPAQIAFAHFDCGFGGEPAQHAATLRRLLECVYPRMPRGAVGVLMDYFDPALCQGRNYNPGVALAAREFFAGKPEQVISLWGGEYPHGFFRKL